jgi:hypothetical protein
MSKLAERIRRTMQGNAKPIGFAAASRASNPSMLLAVSFSTPDAKRASDAATKGADTCLFGPADGRPSDVEAAVKEVGDAPCGVWYRHLDAQVAEQLTEAGADYIVFDADAASAAALLGSDVGYVLAYETDLTDIYVRTLQSFPLDAVFLRDWRSPLTVRGQMDLVRLASLSGKPIMLTISPDIDARELESLRDAGVAIVALDGDDKRSLEALPALRKAIDSLPPRRRRREERPEAIVPRAEPSPSAEEEEEEDEGSW